jgi:hypothetical protein
MAKNNNGQSDSISRRLQRVSLVEEFLGFSDM